MAVLEVCSREAQCCRGKRQYPSEYAALKAVRGLLHRQRQRHTLPMRPYYCPACQAWRIGHYVPD